MSSGIFTRNITTVYFNLCDDRGFSSAYDSRDQMLRLQLSVEIEI